MKLRCKWQVWKNGPFYSPESAQLAYEWFHGRPRNFFVNFPAKMTLKAGSTGVPVTCIFIFAPKRLNWLFRFSRQKRLIGWFHSRPRNFYGRFPAKTAQLAFFSFPTWESSFLKFKHENCLCFSFRVIFNGWFSVVSTCFQIASNSKFTSNELNDEKLHFFYISNSTFGVTRRVA